MGDEVTLRTRAVFEKVLSDRVRKLDDSLEAEKEKDDFLDGLPSIVEAIRSGKIQFRVYRRAKFHVKSYITHARSEVIGAAALVGSSNFTLPGLTQNIELMFRLLVSHLRFYRTGMKNTGKPPRTLLLKCCAQSSGTSRRN
jgi:hypothetical protein